MQNMDLDTLAAAELRELVEGTVIGVQHRFDALDGDMQSAILLLLCAQVLETAAYEITRLSSSDTVSSLIVWSGALNSRAQTKWKNCQQGAET